MLKKVWNDPVWSAVLATVIVTVGGAIGTYLFGLWPTITAAISKAFGYLSQSSSIPNWLLLVISISALPTVLFIIALAWHRLRPNDAEQTGESHANWRTYTNDTFYGLQWRWNYYGGKVSGLLRSVHIVITKCSQWTYQHFEQSTISHSSVIAAAETSLNSKSHIVTLKAKSNGLFTKRYGITLGAPLTLNVGPES